MAKPTTVTELRRFMGMVNQLGKSSSKVAELSQPLRELLGSKRSWVWGPSQHGAFAAVKAELATPIVSALYNQEIATKITADASAYGLGAVLLQQHGDTWKPVAYTSKAMTETERRYSQIEKEALALVWACEKFSDYVIGKKIQLETDHKPLVPLLGKTNLDCLPPRILRFRLRLMRFDYSISHVPGKELYTADALSRSPITLSSPMQEAEERHTELFISAVVSSLPASADRLQEYRMAQHADSDCKQLKISAKEVGQSTKDNLRETFRSIGMLEENLPSMRTCFFEVAVLLFLKASKQKRSKRFTVDIKGSPDAHYVLPHLFGGLG